MYASGAFANLIINGNISKDMKEKFIKIEKLVLPLMIKLAKAPEAYIHWPNRAQVIEEQVRKIVAITRG
jgi:hypothetical protein